MQQQRHRVIAKTWRAIAGVLLISVCVLGSSGCLGLHERSVKPGINDAYKQDPDIEKWKGRFEVESVSPLRHHEH